MNAIKPAVSIEMSFLKALMDLPDPIQKKAREMITKFLHDPASPGLNYEKIQAAKDSKIHSIRVDQSYRAIVLKSAKDDAYILLWVDKHDDAYDWARKRNSSVHPLSGAIQIVEASETESAATIGPEPAVESIAKSAVPELFSGFSDADLRQIGATDETLCLIRSIKDDDDLIHHERRFTPQVYDALFRLACGEAYNEVLEELGIEAGKQYAPDDFKAALELDSNKQQFAAITDDAELEKILNEPLAFWRVFLHPSQRKLVAANFNGPARVLGGAGTGKTVVAMHRAKYLASQCAENERILFTTFTKSLIHDIKKNLQKICSFDELKKIEVLHLDKWTENFLRSRNYKHQITYENNAQRKKLWTQSSGAAASGDFPSDFLRDEWEKVIQYHDVADFAGYAALPRPGRQGRLSRLQRKAIWPVFEEYRTLLNENQIWEPADMFRAARSILTVENTSAGFKHIIVDEIQDFHPQAFRLLRAMTPADQFPKNDLFLVGDGHQNIYGHHIILGQLGIDIRGRGRRLKLNYRTPEETRRWAVSILRDQDVNDLDGGKDSNKGYHSSMSGPEPTFEKCKSFDDEVKHIAAWYRRIREANGGHAACVAVRTNDERDQYAKALIKEGCQIHEITAEAMDIDDPAPLRLATMHRIKGLEFDHVCLASCDPDKLANLPADRQPTERCLLHVAATRTKNSLLITSRM